MSPTTSFSQGDLSVDGNGKITYSGSTTIFKVSGIVNGTLGLSGVDDEIIFAIYKNGSIISSSQQNGIAGVGGILSSVSLQCLVELDDTDFIQVYINNKSGTTNFTLVNVNIIVQSIN